MIVIMHYEVGRLIGNEEQRDVDESSYEKGVSLNDTSNENNIQFSYQGKEVTLKGVHQLRVINLHRSKQRPFRAW